MRVLRISHSAVVSAWRQRERELRAQGVDVHLLSASVWDEGGRPVRLTPGPGEPVQGVRTWGSHPALFVYDPRPLWRALRDRWDLVDIHEEPFALATAEVLALRATSRLVRPWRPPPPYTLYSAQNITKRYPWPFRHLEARALRGAAAVSVCNVEAGRVLRAKGMRGAIEVIPLGLDLARFCPAPPAEPSTDLPEAGRHTGQLTVGYAGRLAAHKGVDVLLRAASLDERLHLRIAGAGPDGHDLRELARPLGDRVAFLGPLDEDALPAFYRGLDALAVPSLETPGWVEQFGRVAVEAMACGTPVVASESGALPDVVGAAGLLVPPGDPRALCDALLRVGEEPGLWDRLRASGLRRAADCSWPEVARRYLEMYRAALQTSSPTSRSDTGRPEPELPVPEVVVVAYRSPDLLRAALAPLGEEFPLTVVDNSSLPEIREITERAGGHYLDPGHNGGFAAGVNHALRHRAAPGRDVLLLNPDAVITAEDIRVLQRGLHAAVRTASAGPVQLDGTGATARVVWPYPSPAGTWIEAVGLGRFRRTPADRSFVIGSVLLLDADALAEVGSFDERFFLYAEETDWAYRATRAGWRHVVVPEAHALHLGSATSDDPVRRMTHFHASQELFLRKHHGAWGWQLARAGAIAGSAARVLVLRGERRAAARLRVMLYVGGPVSAQARLSTAPRVPGPGPA